MSMYNTTSVILITVIKHGSRKSSPTRIRTSGEIPGLRFTTSAYTHTPVVFTSLADCLCGFFLNTRWGYEAVLNTFSCWSFSEIAKHEGKSLKTIRDGVQIAAARIGIVIRPSGRPGRPKKSS